jgi:hypothetical protein
VGLGTALSAGDFNADGRADLAIGAPLANRSGGTDAGMVLVQYGTPEGLFEGESQLIDQEFLFGAGSEDGDRFGSAVAAGDFDGDGRADLAIGVPLEDVGSVVDAGAVFVVYGSTSGLSATFRTPQSWHQDISGIEDTTDTGDLFGSTLSAWNFGRNQFVPGIPIPRFVVTADLAVGVPLENLGGVNNVGAVNVIYGSANGLTSTDDQFFHSGRADIPGENIFNDRFGSALY